MRSDTREPEEQLYSIRQLAKILGISETAARVRVFRGQIKSVKLGASRLVPKSEIDRLLDQSR
jgi:excisionase family DNA binding protein